MCAAHNHQWILNLLLPHNQPFCLLSFWVPLYASQGAFGRQPSQESHTGCFFQQCAQPPCSPHPHHFCENRSECCHRSSINILPSQSVPSELDNAKCLTLQCILQFTTYFSIECQLCSIYSYVFSTQYGAWKKAASLGMFVNEQTNELMNVCYLSSLSNKISPETQKKV